MQWTEMLKAQVEDVYRATDGLIGMAEGTDLDWRPETGHNWMTMGQLLQHIPTACGFCMRGFVTGDWGIPGSDADVSEMSPEEMLPPAENLPTAESVTAIRQQLAEDKKLALQMIDQAGNDDLASKQVAAPWNPQPRTLGLHLLDMVGHLATHKAQLFYYLKLQGKPVNTGTLWGM